ncbi:MAG: hypothetical protein HY667_05540 [Chloroflexi bacterium]|nr:hypothetical protein [Chloroflexota bacterium]
MLAHFLEEEGLPTTQISLIRRHTEVIKPPRALWVPFDLGRPLGAPNDAAFQKRVLVAALKLLEATEGPVLVDYPEEAPVTGEPVSLACPYIPVREDAGTTDRDRLCRSFRMEIASLRPWYDIAIGKRQRTTVGVSRLAPDNLGGFICSFLAENNPENPRTDISLAQELRYAADDLKAYYNEAVTAQPGMTTSDSEALARWFWENTVAGKVLLAVREKCAKSEDTVLQRIGGGQIVPRRFVPQP